MRKVLRTIRVDLSALNPNNEVYVIPLECWRYTLVIYPPTGTDTLINGVPIPALQIPANSVTLSTMYTERVGGYPHQENSVNDSLQIVFGGAGVRLQGVVIIETWQDE